MIRRDSELASRFYEHGRLPECPVYNMHAHMHELPGGYIPAPEPEDMLRTMDRVGTPLTLFCSHLALFCPEIGETANMEVVARHPNRFRAYHAVMSRHTDPEMDLKRIDEHPEVYVGCKFLCDYFGIRLSDEIHTPYWEYLNQNKLLVLSHTWGGSPVDGVEEMRRIASRYPDITLICGHSFHGDWENGIRLALEYPNIYLELTAVLDDRGVLESMVDGIGSERILYGDDLPWFSTFHGVGAVLSADITDDDRHNILHRNAERILSRFDWFTGVSKVPDDRIDK